MNTNHHPGHHLTTLLYHNEASGVQKARFAHRYGVRGFGTRGVQKARFAHRYGVRGTGFGASRCVKGRFTHRYGVSGLAVCKRVDLHTETVVVGRAR